MAKKEKLPIRGVRIDIEIPQELEERLRAEAIQRTGGKRGGLRTVIIEALEEYLKK
jgi:hypothetical protein